MLEMHHGLFGIILQGGLKDLRPATKTWRACVSFLSRNYLLS